MGREKGGEERKEVFKKARESKVESCTAEPQQTGWMGGCAGTKRDDYATKGGNVHERGELLLSVLDREGMRMEAE